ncbi:MAG: DUF1330 domain-containing protein [Pseudomonadota bacterium]
MSALWIAHVTVHDDEAYAEYAAIATESIAEYGGVFLARGGRYVQFEGTDRPRNVVARFPSFEDAVACYKSPRYQEAVKIAKSASTRELMILDEAPA